MSKASKKHTESRQLPVKLTKEEILEKASELARATQEHERAINVKKVTSAQLKNDVDDKANNVKMVAEIVASGHEVRPVQCEWRFAQPKNGKKQLVRLDTGDVVETRDMVGDDYQGELKTVVEEAEAQQPPKPAGPNDIRDVTGKVIEIPGAVVLALPAPKEDKGKKGKKDKPAKKEAKPKKDKPAKDAKPKKAVTNPLALAKAIMTDATTPGHLKWKTGDKATIDKVLAFIEDARALAGEDQKKLEEIGEAEDAIKQHLDELKKKKK